MELDPYLRKGLIRYMADNDISDLKGDVRVLTQAFESGQKETNRRLDKIEGKIDAQSNVAVSVFDEYKRDAAEAFVTKESHNNMGRRVALLEKSVYGFIGLVLLIVLGAIINGALK